MRRAAIVTLGVVAGLLVVSQLVLPGLAERRVEEGLTEDGGSAEADLDAIPALRLLFGDGDRLVVEGQGLRVDPAPLDDEGLFDRLDGFGEVEIKLTDLGIGPFDFDTVFLRRAEGSDAYELDADGSFTGRDLAEFASRQVGGPLGSILGGFAAGSIPLTDVPIPVDLRARLVSEDGRMRVERADGTVAGLPADPLVEVIVAAIADGIEG
jgi:hypothetical protein